jgi:LytR cell envelope-related transcriptional attenuator
VERCTLIRRLTVVGAVAAMTGGAGVLFARSAPSNSARVTAPAGVRIRVQVLNATPTRGLARRATGFLRDRGFDVVDVGTAGEPRDSTLVIDRSEVTGWAQLVARALGGAPVESHPDSSRYLDVTVLVGRNWTPPAEPFYP